MDSNRKRTVKPEIETEMEITINNEQRSKPITGEEISQIRMVSGRSIHSTTTTTTSTITPPLNPAIVRPAATTTASNDGGGDSGIETVPPKPPATSSTTIPSSRTGTLNTGTMLTKSTTRIAKTSRLKFLVLGSPNVGKTLILRRMQNMNWTLIYDTTKYTPTIGPDLHRLKCGTIEAIDIGGQERLMPISRKYCELFHVFVVVFDLTNAETFLMARYWLDFITSQNNSDFEQQSTSSSAIQNNSILLIGNKNDLIDQRKVGVRLAKNLAMSYGAQYLEISAKLDLTMDLVLETLEKETSK